MGALVVGLGNPGPKYERNRHNFGHLLVNALAEKISAPPWQVKFSGHFCRVRHLGEHVALLKPSTFMNLSGRSVAPAAHYFKTAIEDVIVVHDELDLPFGTIRLKKGGGTAGHNGLESIKQELGSPGFLRLRMGIGRPGPEDSVNISDYVLHNFSIKEQASLIEIMAKGSRIVECILRSGAVAAMNQFNKRGGETDGS